MKYYAVKFQIECAPELLQTARELLADDAAKAGFESFEDTEDGLVAYVQEELFNRAMLNDVIAPFAFVIPNVGINYEIEEIEPKNWNETWESEGFDPIFIGDRCVIYDARRLQTPPLSSFFAPLRIGIETKMAFGTGTHETTQQARARLRLWHGNSRHCRLESRRERGRGLRHRRMERGKHAPQCRAERSCEPTSAPRRFPRFEPRQRCFRCGRREYQSQHSPRRLATLRRCFVIDGNALAQRFLPRRCTSARRRSRKIRLETTNRNH